MSEQSVPKSFSGPIAWMASNSVAANLLMLVFLVGGFIVSTQVKQEVFPEFATDIVQISVPYPGASPAEVEQGIILSIEDGVRGLDGIKRVTSTAVEGSASVIVELLSSSDPSKLLQDVKNQVDRISSFPEDAERPVVSLIESRRRVISLLVSGNQDPRDLRDFAEQVRDELAQSPGVTLVEFGSAPNREISVEISQETLRSYGLSLEDVAREIRRSALELPAGEVKSDGGRILLRTQERRDYAHEFLDVPVASNVDGSQILLSDIADVRDDFEESDKESRYNGVPSVLIHVFRVGDETPQAVSEAVYRYIDEIKSRLPGDVKLTIWEDMSVNYKDRMSLLLKNAGLGLILVLALLGLFLEPKLAFWVTLGIPISIMGCFLFLPFTGASINMISLFAFIVTLGIIVDDAVVMGENIHERREQGRDPLSAAIIGAKEIATPIFFAVLTNIVAFMPLFFVPGVSGKFFRQIPAVAVGVFIISLIESIYILPAHLAHTGTKASWFSFMDSARSKCASFLERFMQERYLPVVQQAIRYRYLTLSIAVGVLLIAFGSVVGGHLRFSFIPKIDADLISVQANLPFGAPMHRARNIQERLELAAISALEDLGGAEYAKGVYSQIGDSLVSQGPGPKIGLGGGSHLVAAQVSLVPTDQRDFSGTEFARIWRKQIGTIPGLESLVFRADTGANEGAAIEFNLSHRDRAVLERAAEDLRLELERYVGVSDIEDGVESGKRQLSFKLTPEARSLGVTANDLARQVRAAFYGAEALRQQRGRNEVKVLVRLPKSERATMNTLSELIILTPGGGELPLFQAASVEEGSSYTEISRRDGQRVITVKADVDNELSNAGQINGDLEKRVIPQLQLKYPGLRYSFGGEREAQKESLGALGVGFIFALFVIYALLAVPFKSYAQPVIVMMSIPFGIIGAVLGHFLLGYGLSIISMFGVIALSGVVVNDSLVLVVTANRIRESESSDASRAIILAGLRRFRPIILTSLTTFFGLAPMIFETSMQARFLIPMAISLGFGILFATIIILIIVPAIYMILEDFAPREKLA